MKTLVKLAVVLALLTISALPAAAAEPTTFQADTTSWLGSAQWLPVGDSPGHAIGLQKREGDAVLSSGETAKYSNIFTLDFRQGKGGTAVGYSTFTFADGSTIMFSWTCDITVANAMFAKEGQGTLLKGTGRFADLQGTATFEGRQLKPQSEDPKVTATTTYRVTVR